MHSWIDIPLRDGKDADEWELTESKAIANIDQWYQEGRLLFPRDSLQEVRDQLRKPLKKGDSIYVKGFDGSMYEWPVKTGNIKTHWEADNNTGEEKQVDWMLHHPAHFLSLIYRAQRFAEIQSGPGVLQRGNRTLDNSRRPRA